MNIVLIGFRGVGKSTIGKIISAKKKMMFVDTDDYIEKDINCTITEIVGKCGWPRFREEEEIAVEKISLLDNCVVSCGGGVPLNPKNVQNLIKNGKIILLTADADVIKERLIENGIEKRPSLTGNGTVGEIKDVLKKRIPLYNAAADLRFDTSKDLAEEVAEKIINALG